MISCLVLPRYSRKTAPSSEGILYHVVLCLIFVGYIPIKKIIAYFCGPGGKKKVITENQRVVFLSAMDVVFHFIGDK